MNAALGTSESELKVAAEQGIEVRQAHGGPRIGIWPWPDNQVPGERENFAKAIHPPPDRKPFTPARQ